MKKNDTIVGITLLSCLLVVGCGTAEIMLSPTPTPSPTTIPVTPIPVTPIPPSAEPDWLSILYPKPGQIVLLEEYNASEHETHSGSLPAPEVPSAICVQIWADDLFEAGDFWEMGDVVEKTDLLVDGIPRQCSGDGYDGIVLNTITDSEGKVTASVGGPYAFCFSAKLQPGIHRADIGFRKSSGTTEKYSWTFEITNHSIPTPTPLPNPPIIDNVGNLPNFLKAVYPSPGKTTSLTQNQGEAIDEF